MRPTGSAYGSSPHTRGARSARPSCCSRTWDHPRIRGEHPHRPEDVEAAPRIIPAYAGSTTDSTNPRSKLAGSSPHTRGAPKAGVAAFAAVGDHPRIRGEHVKAARSTVFMSGSSPHTRGAQVRRPRHTPCSWDHPRIRGEHLSSAHLPDVRDGIIPAYAGSTSTAAAGLPGGRDHPRIRGEHAGVSVQGGDGDGIIPAYAGSTYWRITQPYAPSESSPHTRGARTPACTAAAATRDHPRIRGEHHVVHVVDAVVHGIIPAYAGSTFAIMKTSQGTWGSSPHTRGAHRLSSCSSTRAGDHPRIRGEHQRHRGAVGEGRGIIPAYAGSTSVTGEP